MPNKPRSLVVLSFILVLVACSIPAQIMFIDGHGLSEWRMVLAKIAPLNWVVIFSTLASALAIFQASPFALVLAPLSIAFVNWNNLVVGSYELQYSLGFTFIGSLAFALIHFLMISEDAKNVLLRPGLRWWRNPRRHRVLLTLEIQRLSGDFYTGHTFDLSRGGAFIPFASFHRMEGPDNSPLFPPDGLECVMLRLSLNSAPIQCQARIVRKSKAQGNYPAGIGIKFLDLGRENQRTLERYLKNANDSHPRNSFSPYQ